MCFNLHKFILKIDREVSNYLNVNNLGNGRLFMAAGCTMEYVFDSIILILSV